MADSKITALASIGTGTDPANDPLVIVDVSDVSPGGMSATGTTKKVTLNNLLACSPIATLASATITGDLTVKTNVLKVDTTNNRVGIGTASPESQLDVRGLIAVRGTPTFPTTGVGPELFWSPGNSNSNLYSYNRGTSAWAEMAYGALSHVFQISGSDAMRLNSTGLGVGGNPVSGVLLTVGSTSSVSATANALQVLSNKATFVITADGATNGAGTTINYSWANGGQGPLIFRNAAISNVMTLDASGNVISNVTGTAPTLGTNNQMVFNLTSNTNLRISVRGSDGVTRTANITLA